MDPTEYTSADAYAQYVADNMPDLSEVSAAALALIRAIRKLEDNRLVTKVDPVERISELLAEVITECLNYDEDDRFELYIRDAVDEDIADERRKWINTINRDAADAKLTQPTIDLAGMVMGILGGK